MTGIEPASSAWEADVLPLNYTRVSCEQEQIDSSQPVSTGPSGGSRVLDSFH